MMRTRIYFIHVNRLWEKKKRKCTRRGRGKAEEKQRKERKRPIRWTYSRGCTDTRVPTQSVKGAHVTDTCTYASRSGQRPACIVTNNFYYMYLTFKRCINSRDRRTFYARKWSVWHERGMIVKLGTVNIARKRSPRIPHRYHRGKTIC